MEALPNEDERFWLVTSFDAAEILEGHIPYFTCLRQAWRRTRDHQKEEVSWGAEVAKRLQDVEGEDIQIWEGRFEYRSRKETLYK